jgi:hypothetical protein
VKAGSDRFSTRGQPQRTHTTRPPTSAVRGWPHWVFGKTIHLRTPTKIHTAAKNPESLSGPHEVQASVTCQPPSSLRGRSDQDGPGPL